jgi:uncharacterized protein YecE (DUF72 family)
MAAAGELRVGTSGYQYRHWRGDFYPTRVPQRAWFRYYAERFDTVEINSTFYGLPDPETVDRWREEAPPGFRFAVKFSRYGTHVKRLTDAARTLERFLAVAERLKARLGPILVQLPPKWGADPERLTAFLRATPRRHRVAVEMRDPSWLCEAVYDVLREHDAALVLHDLIPDHPVVLTTRWTYLRFHGRDHGGGYSPQALSGQARHIRRWLGDGRDVWAYFNNDVGGYAPRDARNLRRFVERPR